MEKRYSRPQRSYRSGSSSRRRMRQRTDQDNQPMQRPASRVVSFRAERNRTEDSARMKASGTQDGLQWLNWPLQWFDLMTSAWRGALPAAWMEQWLSATRPLFPRVQTKETDDGYLYQIDLPGVSHEQIALSFRNGMIMLRVEASGKGGATRLLRRALSLPVYTDGEGVRARLSDGMLRIMIPKSRKPTSPEPRDIEVE